MFRKPAIAALDAAELSWVNAVDSGNNFESGVIACAADMGIRADLRGFKAPGIAEINDVGGRLPELPTYYVNLYTAERVGAANDKITQEFARLIEETFAREHSKDCG